MLINNTSSVAPESWGISLFCEALLSFYFLVFVVCNVIYDIVLFVAAYRRAAPSCINNQIQFG